MTYTDQACRHKPPLENTPIHSVTSNNLRLRIQQKYVDGKKKWESTSFWLVDASLCLGVPQA